MAMCEYLLPLGTPRHPLLGILSLFLSHIRFPSAAIHSHWSELHLQQCSTYCRFRPIAARLPHNQQKSKSLLPPPSPSGRDEEEEHRRNALAAVQALTVLFVRNRETDRSPTSDDDDHASFRQIIIAWLIMPRASNRRVNARLFQHIHPESTQDYSRRQSKLAIV